MSAWHAARRLRPRNIAHEQSVHRSTSRFTPNRPNIENLTAVAQKEPEFNGL